MSVPLMTDPASLHTDADGVIRIGGTRVSLDTLVEAFAERERRRRKWSRNTRC